MSLKDEFKTDDYVNLMTEMLEKYESTGDISVLENDIQYLYGVGFTNEDIGNLLSVPTTEIDKTVPLYKDMDTSNLEDANVKLETSNILGMPFLFTPLTDPKRRIYDSVMLTDLPIVSIIPGRPEFKKYDPNSSSGSSDEATHIEETSPKTEGQIMSWLLSSAKNTATNRDIRYYGFRPDFASFCEHLQLMVSTVGIKMGAIGGFYNVNEDIKRNFMEQGLKFYCDKSTSVSESIDNQFGQSNVSGMFNNISGIAKELQFLTGQNKVADSASMNETLAKEYEELENEKSGLLSKIANTAQGMFNNAETAISGSNIHFPEIWKDSSFSRQYRLDFKFSSPYGTPKAIFDYVYLPFLTLLTMSMPRQDSLMGYYSPYILRVDMPGVFTTDMAVITSMSFKKGGNDNLFSKDGLPLEITVSINVKDLYPVLAMTNDYKVLRHNTAMYGFLDNLAGLSIERFEPMQDMMDSINMRTAYVAGLINRVPNRVMDWANRSARSILHQNH